MRAGFSMKMRARQKSRRPLKKRIKGRWQDKRILYFWLTDYHYFYFFGILGIYAKLLFSLKWHIEMQVMISFSDSQQNLHKDSTISIKLTKIMEVYNFSSCFMSGRLREFKKGNDCVDSDCQKIGK